MNTDIRRKRFTLRVATKQGDGEAELEDREVLAQFATLGVVDHDGDLIEEGAIGDQDVFMAGWGHDHWSLPPGSGKTYEEDDAAMFKGRFFDTTTGQDHYETIKAVGGQQEWSFGFRVIDGAFETHDGKDVYVIRKTEILEVSPVLQGAGIGTRTVAIKECDGECQARRTQGKHLGFNPVTGLPEYQSEIGKSADMGEATVKLRLDTDEFKRDLQAATQDLTQAFGDDAILQTLADAVAKAVVAGLKPVLGERPVGNSTPAPEPKPKPQAADPEAPEPEPEPVAETQDPPPDDDDTKSTSQLDPALQRDIDALLNRVPTLGTPDDALSTAVNELRARVKQE